MRPACLRQRATGALVGVVLVCGALLAQEARRPRVALLATGGTIAGVQAAPTDQAYRSGVLDVDALIDSVPGLRALASISGEQVANVGSQDMTDAIWLRLARRVNALLREADIDAVVITHGTDTLEETAYFLNLVVASPKPVVVVGAMRPATAIGADGPANLYNAVATAVHPAAMRRGVMVVINDEIHAARNVVKTDTTSLEAFASPNRGPLGLVHTGRVVWFEPMDKRHTTTSEFTLEDRDRLPRVDILYAHANMSADLVDAAVRLGAQGLVVAGVGDGNVPQPVLDALARARASGVVVVRSTRLLTGLVSRNAEIDDDTLGLVASGELGPAKARVLLQLALTRTTDPRRIQQMFDEY